MMCAAGLYIFLAYLNFFWVEFSIHLRIPFRREYSSVYFVCFVPFKCKPYQPIHPQNFSEYANAGIAISVGSRAHSMSCRRFLSQVVTDRRGETRKNRSATIYTSILILCTCAHVLRIAPYVLRALCDLSLPKCMDRSWIVLVSHSFFILPFPSSSAICPCWQNL